MPYIANQPMDAQFLALYRKGDETAFRELFNRYQQAVYMLLWRYLGRHDLVEDTLQETFLQLYISRLQYNNSRPLDAWLYTIAANKAKDALRQSRQQRLVSISNLLQGDEPSFEGFLNILVSNDSDPVEPLEQAEKNNRIRHVLADLPKKHRVVLTLAYFKQLKYKQIADTLDIPIGTVKSRLHKAIALFGREWQSFCECSPLLDSTESKKGRVPSWTIR